MSVVLEGESSSRPKTILEWLTELKLEKYAENFQQCGYDDLDQIQDLTEDDLDIMSIRLPGHRSRILKNIPGHTEGATSSSTDEVTLQPVLLPPSTEIDTSGLDDVLDNLTSMVGELDDLVQENKISPSKISTRNSLLLETGDNDLEDILEELCSFGSTSQPDRRTSFSHSVITELPDASHLPHIHSSSSHPQLSVPEVERSKGLSLPDGGDKPERPSSFAGQLSSPSSQALGTDLSGSHPNIALNFKGSSGSLNNLNNSTPTTRSNLSIYSDLHPEPKPGSPSSSSLYSTSSPNALRKPVPYAIYNPREQGRESPPGPPKPPRGSRSSLPGFNGTESLTPPRSPGPAPRLPNESADQLKMRLHLIKDRLRSMAVDDESFDQMMKEEKIRIAMEKMAEASVTKEVIRIFNSDGTSKTMIIESNQPARMVCDKIVAKSYYDDSPNWSLVEQFADLHIERVLEDHESVADAYALWPPSSPSCRFMLRNDPMKYGVFVHPDEYFPSHFKEDLKELGGVDERLEKAKRVILQEFFSTTTRIPDLKGYLREREGKDGKKWKKKYFMLRSSGIYYSTKGDSEAPKDLMCFVKFDDHDLCVGVDFKKHYSAPTEFVFCFKPHARKKEMTVEDVRSLCVADAGELRAWVAGVRLAKFGLKLRENYETAVRKYDKLVQMGALPTSAKDMLSPTVTSKGPVQDKNLIELWKRQRCSKKHPGVSAATGVEFNMEDGNPLFLFPWYHGPIPRTDAEKILEELHFKEGVYLVRDSSTHPGDFVLTVCYSHSPHHFHIKRLDAPSGGHHYAIDDGPRFAALENLIEHYHSADERLPTILCEPAERPW